MMLKRDTSLLIVFPEKIEVLVKGQNRDGTHFYPGDVLFLSSNNQPIAEFSGRVRPCRLYEFIKKGPGVFHERGSTYLNLLEIDILTGKKTKPLEKPKKKIFSRRMH